MNAVVFIILTIDWNFIADSCLALSLAYCEECLREAVDSRAEVAPG